MYRYKLLFKKYGPLVIWVITAIIMVVIWTQNIIWLLDKTSGL